MVCPRKSNVSCGNNERPKPLPVGGDFRCRWLSKVKKQRSGGASNRVGAPDRRNDCGCCHPGALGKRLGNSFPVDSTRKGKLESHCAPHQRKVMVRRVSTNYGSDGSFGFDAACEHTASPTSANCAPDAYGFH